MSTTTNLSLQFYDRSGAPIPASVTREHLVDLTRAAFEHSGTHLGRDVVDLHLLEIVDKAACSLLRDQWTDGFPVAAYTELLTTIAALRSVLGYAPTPTARDVNAWALGLRRASAEAAGADRDIHEVRICEGPHTGIVLGLYGPKAPQALNALPGPPLVLELPTERGDSTDMEYGTAYYQRLRQPGPDTGQWEYILDRGHDFPAGGSRPRFLPTGKDA
ncbi:hypothetical protein [Streptomyces similanensis]|uniref:Uncharacterized protein n=1 Tax=Streptomyces similanensis TaxID=1274988 RepID=A0ABP9L818_9ACTN